MSLGERLKAAMKHGGFETDRQVVDAIHVALGVSADDIPMLSQQMISKIRRDDLKSGQSHLFPYIAFVCGVSAIWLAAELGPMIPWKTKATLQSRHISLLNNYLKLPKELRFHIRRLIDVSVAVQNPRVKARTRRKKKT
ncbi:hypothetical protein LCGC14_1942490 [marine sediment metagenome]|uniref:Uncharacterized protein n=1 Tax=marine sediment metagenome TaxID=412755 RepID=A0A0F9IH12_9ZZZZ